MSDKLLSTLEEIASFVGCSERTIRRRAAEGLMPEPLFKRDGKGKWKHNKLIYTREQLLDLRKLYKKRGKR